MYVYQWCYPNGLPFYIGMGVRGRVTSMRGRSKTVKAICKKIESGGHQVIREIIRDNLSFGQAQILEIETIARYGRRCKGDGILANYLPGGECPGHRAPKRPPKNVEMVKRTPSFYTDPSKKQARAEKARVQRAVRSVSFRTRSKYGK